MNLFQTFVNQILSRKDGSTDQPNAKLQPVRRGLAFGNATRRPHTDHFGRTIDTRVFFWLYRQQSDLSGAVDILQTNTGLAGHQWTSPKPDTEPSVQLEAKMENILNFEEPFEVFKNKMIRDYSLAGNGYAVFVENLDKSDVLGIQNIDPRTMAVVIDQFGQIWRYIQKIPGEQAVIFAPEDVIHFKVESDPDHEVFGFPRLTPATLEVLTDIEARALNIAFFQNDARPSTLYILEEGMSEEEQETAMEKIRSLFGGGGSNKKKSASIAGVKEIKTLGATQTEMEFLEQRKLSTEKICSALRVPKFLLGYTDAVNNNNGVELAKNFVRKTIEPIESAFARTLNRAFAKKIKGYADIVKIDGVNTVKFNIEFSFKQQVLESANELEKRAIEMKKNGIMTTREAKQFLGQEVTPDMESQENMDKFIIDGGSSAALLEEVGVDPILDPNNPDKANNFVKSLEKLKHGTE